MGLGVVMYMGLHGGLGIHSYSDTAREATTVKDTPTHLTPATPELPLARPHLQWLRYPGIKLLYKRVHNVPPAVSIALGRSGYEEKALCNLPCWHLA